MSVSYSEASLSQAINSLACMFPWRNSIEGYEYWSDVFHILRGFKKGYMPERTPEPESLRCCFEPDDFVPEECDKAAASLFVGLDWGETPQGGIFWANVYTRLKSYAKGEVNSPKTPEEMMTDHMNSAAVCVEKEYDNKAYHAAFGKGEDPKQQYGVAKPCVSFMPQNVILKVADVLKAGAAKYGRHNWRHTNPMASTYYDAAIRHEAAWWEGKDVDPETGYSHLDHAIASLMILRDIEARGNMTDDRPSTDQEEEGHGYSI